MPVVQRAAKPPSDIDPAARELLRPHLAPGEALAWAGRPAKGRFGRGSWFLFLFAVPWTAFALFWEGGVLATTSGLERAVMGLFGIPFVLIGLGMLSAPFFAMAAGKRLVYGATTERVLLLRTGRKPRLLAYGPADLAELRRENEQDGLVDVFFAVDAGVSDVVPAARGKGGGTLAKVGFVGVPPAAVRAIEAVRARKAPGTPAPAMAIPGAAPATLEARGGLEACAVKLRAALGERRAAEARRQARWSQRFWLVAGLVLVAPPALGFANEGLGGAFFGLFATFMLGIFAAVAFFILKAVATAREAELTRFDALEGLLAAWKADVHPKARLHAQLDLGPACGVRPYRFANSASSGALKTWHRHRWARFVWATACGSPVVVELVDKVKYKAGSEVERHPLVRGWVVPNEAIWGDVELQPFQAGPLTVSPLVVEGQRVLAFRGAVKDAAEAGQALTALYRALAKRRRLPAS